MKKKENSIQRQFLLYFVLPLFLIIVGAVILDRIISNSSTNIETSITVSSDQAATEVVLQLTALEITETPPSNKENPTETDQADQPGKTSTSGTKPIEKTEMLFYAGFVVCGGILLLILIAGGVLFLTPSKK
jgi:hypothetical protein